MAELDRIGADLSDGVDVLGAGTLETNSKSGCCFQGLTHGHEGFLLDANLAKFVFAKDPTSREVVFPYLIGDDLLGTNPPHPQRFVIDFQPRNVIEASAYRLLMRRVRMIVLPARQEAANREKERNLEVLLSAADAKVNRHHANFLARWWLLSWPRPELVSKLAELSRYIVCSRVTRRPVFEFVSSTVRPGDSLQVFPLDDDYSFGILQSDIHWQWFEKRCSTMKNDPRYTSTSVFDTFPWPQSPSASQVSAVAVAGRKLRALRHTLEKEYGMTLREMYKSLDDPGKNPLRSAGELLSKAVRMAYGMSPTEDPLAFLVDLNGQVAQKEALGKPAVGPGIPPSGAGILGLVSGDCIE